MNKREILSWKNKYDKEEDLYNKGDEEELRSKFQKNQYVTKEELIRIVKWKFQGPLIPRGERFLKLLEDVDGEFIKDLSKLAFRTGDEETRIKLFCTIKGVGPAVTSVILAFYDPKNYGVFDIHAWRELFGKGRNISFGSPKCCMEFFKELRALSKKHGLSCRDVEKALFKKNYEESKR